MSVNITHDAYVVTVELVPNATGCDVKLTDNAGVPQIITPLRFANPSGADGRLDEVGLLMFTPGTFECAASDSGIVGLIQIGLAITPEVAILPLATMEKAVLAGPGSGGFVILLGMDKPAAEEVANLFAVAVGTKGGNQGPTILGFWHIAQVAYTAVGTIEVHLGSSSQPEFSVCAGLVVSKIVG